MITVEMAADIVKALPPGNWNHELKELDTDIKYEAFSIFDEMLNPFPSDGTVQQLKDGIAWQEFFAQLCGFGIAKNVSPLE